jgi:sulfonate transport system substrate-binding protein
LVATILDIRGRQNEKGAFIMKKTLALLLAMLIAVSVLGSCGTNSSGPVAAASDKASAGTSSGAAQNAQLFEIKSSGQSSIQSSMPIVAGQNKGIFEKYGITVPPALYYNSGPPQLEAQPGGDWDIGWMGFTATITGIMKYDMSAICLSGFDETDMIIAREDSDIYAAGLSNISGAETTYGTAELWKGKSIIVQAGTVAYCNLLLTLKALGLTVDDVTIINMDPAQGQTAFMAGQGDLWVPVGIYSVNALNKGYVAVSTMKGLGANMPAAIIASKEYLKEHETEVVEYLAAVLESVAYVKDEANKEQEGEWYIQFMHDEFGVDYDKDTASAIIDLCDFRDLDFYESLCAAGSDGKTGMQTECAKFFDNHVLVGLTEEKNRDTVLGACDPSYLAKAIELYKQKNGIS